MVAVALTRDEHTAGDLRRYAAACREAAAARRMLALALVLEGSPRAVAAKTCGMDRQTLRDGVHRYNAAGLDGLLNRREGLGRKPLLTPEQTAVVAELVRNGPDLATHGVVRWRRADLAPVIEQRFGVRPDVRTVGKLLRRLGFRRLSVRPRHPGHDAAAQEAHKKTSPPSLLQRSRSTPAASRSSSGGKTKPASASRAP
jgi:transposase